MLIYIRSDASTKIGSGHVIRCLTLARHLKLQGAKVVFICREDPGNLIEMVQVQGFEVQCLPSIKGKTVSIESEEGQKQFRDACWEIDAREVKEILQQKARADWLIVDHYIVDQRWENAMKSMVRNIMVIDDLADRIHDCDLLLDQNLHPHSERYRDLIPSSCISLLGPKYALLYPEYQTARAKLGSPKQFCERLVVFMGGGDPTNQTQKCLEAVHEAGIFGLKIDVVIGRSNPYREKLEHTIKKTFTSMILHVQVDNMVELLCKADLAIGAGGSNTWERCCLGVPSIMFATSFNQISIAKAAAEKGYGVYLGFSNSVTTLQIAKELKRLTHHSNQRIQMAKKAMCAVDGRGTERVVQHLLH